jgi:Holliday junction resolvase RusA-like endonuclease
MGKGRPRFSCGHAYTPSKTREFEAEAKDAALHAMHGRKPLTGPLKAEIVAFFAPPKSMSRKDRELVRQGLLFPRKRLDIDNIAKAVLDACNSAVFHDDSQVMILKIAKVYSVGGRAGIRVHIAQIRNIWDR